MAAREREAEDAAGREEAPPPEGGRTPEAPQRKHSRRFRAMAVLLVLAFVALQFWPFLTARRARYVFTRLPHVEGAAAAPGRVDLRPADIRAADSIVVREVRRETFPGAVLAVGQGGTRVLEAGYGRVGWTRLALPADPTRTLYDLSSLTKVMATTTAVMLLVDEGKMRLDDPIAKWLPAFRGGGREKVTVAQVLSHTSGLPAGRKVEGGSARERINNLVATVPLVDDPGAGVIYSDVGFIILFEAASRAAGEPLPDYLRRKVWTPLGMTATRYQPGIFCGLCAPTLSLRDGRPFAGKTNDPQGRELGGVVGNAGLFSTAHDVGRFAAMIANRGELDGVRVLKPETIDLFTRPRKGTRALGFEWFCREGTVPYEKPCKEPFAFGHTGYTGTSIWIDPASRAWVVLLSNRTYLPRAPADRMRIVRRRLFETVTGQRDTTEKRSPKS
ncbi:MAG TPA: serine hydrolase domain-containing protein [Longimicrobium sp.]|nr:serine hydrolase domain-containing protein [Longimicrobium sp.]